MGTPPDGMLVLPDSASSILEGPRGATLVGSVGLTEILLLTVMFITAFFSSGDINRDAVTARFPMSSLALLGSIGVCGISGSSFSNSHAGTAIVVGLPSSMLVVKMRLHSHAA